MYIYCVYLVHFPRSLYYRICETGNDRYHLVLCYYISLLTLQLKIHVWPSNFFFYVFDTTVCNVLLSIRYDTFGVKNLNNDKCSPLAVNLMFWVFFFGGGLFTMRKMTNKHYEKASFEGYSLFVETV